MKRSNNNFQQSFDAGSMLAIIGTLSLIGVFSLPPEVLFAIERTVDIAIGILLFYGLGILAAIVYNAVKEYAPIKRLCRFVSSLRKKKNR